MTALPATNVIDPGRVRELTEREAKRLEEATQASRRMYERAHKVLPLGVPSSYHARDPWPIYVERGEGAVVWDADGRKLWDFHNGFGSMVMGHAHPAIVKTISERARLGTHFSAPTEDGIVVAEELARRFGLPSWRFCNSGTETTMDAVHLMRAITGRDLIALLASSVNAADGNIEKISMDERDGRISVVQLVVSVHDRVHLARVIKKLRALKGVIRITRVRA